MGMLCFFFFFSTPKFFSKDPIVNSAVLGTFQKTSSETESQQPSAPHSQET